MKDQPLSFWTAEAHKTAGDKGFWNRASSIITPQFLALKIALIHAEVSELLEAVRDRPSAPCDKGIDLTREQEEVADIFLRLADYCGAREIDLDAAVAIKHEYNLTREFKHGKSF